MSSPVIRAAFIARLQTWTHLGACPFADFDVVSNASLPVIELQFPAASERIVSVGKPALARTTGGARFVITLAKFGGVTLDQALQWIEELRDLYRLQMFGGVETFEAGPASLDDRINAGNTVRLAFAVTFKFDRIAG